MEEVLEKLDSTAITPSEATAAMDAVLEQLVTTVITPNEWEVSKTNYDGLYKNWGKLGSQDERRREILTTQKQNRYDKLDKFRGILELVKVVEASQIFKTHNKAYYRPSIYVAGFIKAPSYDQVLMMSEWLTEKPFDFEENWLVVPTPKGVRVLVVAYNGNTRLFSKYGHFLFECRTALPGGNPRDPKAKTNCCVLDCFYQKMGNILYVLDILAWNSQPMTDGECEFRDYWLKSQFTEISGLTVLNKHNELIFTLLPKVSCKLDSLNKFMMKVHFDDSVTGLDGLLFYHRKGHYHSGATPLVGWLYPYMVCEVLGDNITVNVACMIEKPVNYTNQADFINQFNAKIEYKKVKALNKHASKNSQMDTTDVGQTEVNIESKKKKAHNKKADKSSEMDTADLSQTEVKIDSKKKKALNKKLIKSSQMDTADISQTETTVKAEKSKAKAQKKLVTQEIKPENEKLEAKMDDERAPAVEPNTEEMEAEAAV